MSAPAHDVDFQFAAPARQADDSAHRVVAISDQTGPRARQASGRPPQMADWAQARLFYDLLEAELIELERATDALQDQWRRRYANRNGGNHDISDSLVRHQQELSEVRGLLAALRDRFPPLTTAVG